jgi:hypothetical protein
LIAYAAARAAALAGTQSYNITWYYSEFALSEAAGAAAWRATTTVGVGSGTTTTTTTP